MGPSKVAWADKIEIHEFSQKAEEIRSEINKRKFQTL